MCVLKIITAASYQRYIRLVAKFDHQYLTLAFTVGGRFTKSYPTISICFCTPHNQSNLITGYQSAMKRSQ